MVKPSHYIETLLKVSDPVYEENPKPVNNLNRGGILGCI